MKRSLLVMLAVIALAGWLGTLIARDPGYVLVSWDGSSLQTSLWVAIGLFVVLAFLVYYGVRVVRWLMHSGGYLLQWQGNRQRRRALELTARGLQYFLEEDYERAERFLVSGAKGNRYPGINHLFAAWAADRSGHDETRETRLRQVDDRGLEQAKALTSGRLNAARKNWQQCLTDIASARETDPVLGLRKEAMVHLEDWLGLLELLPRLKKILREEDYILLEKTVALGRFSTDSVSADDRKKLYRRLCADNRRDPEIVSAYTESLLDPHGTEKLLRGLLHNEWQPELLDLYGNNPQESLAVRIRHAESWLKNHREDAALQLCLGKLYESRGDNIKAREAYDASVSLEGSREAWERLAALLAFEGDYVRSNECLKAALALS